MADRNPPARPPSYDKKIGLVLQGGGALGSYQAGVYEALAHSDYVPDWVASISIGAINAAIIAGNTPENRLNCLRSFWDVSASPSAPGGALISYYDTSVLKRTLEQLVDFDRINHAE
jgi:NTE family protein